MESLTTSRRQKGDVFFCSPSQSCFGELMGLGKGRKLTGLSTGNLSPLIEPGTTLRSQKGDIFFLFFEG